MRQGDEERRGGKTRGRKERTGEGTSKGEEIKNGDRRVLMIKKIAEERENVQLKIIEEGEKERQDKEEEIMEERQRKDGDEMIEEQR